MKHAGFLGNTVLHGVTPSVQWHQLQHECANGRILVDVRSASENPNSSIPGIEVLNLDEGYRTWKTVIYGVGR